MCTQLHALKIRILQTDNCLAKLRLSNLLHNRNNYSHILHFFFHETHLYSKIRISLIKRRAGLDVMQSQPLHVQGRISANTAPHHHDSNFCSSSQFNKVEWQYSIILLDYLVLSRIYYIECGGFLVTIWIYSIMLSIE